ncbi:DUF3772 domain-containing protein [uncultured Sulfitobacter sp.]|uniref:DUF3772 domain-containing protein n=1 Tax=uncultured Sulfitobacter sp. TaxID=191468 RepID=UPI002605007D|nr:DUF3772 domain-containing protein [uncultured Sulfitobacter sp.]
MIRSLQLGLGRLAALVGLILLCAAAVSAQEVPGVDMAGWNALTSRAEQAVDSEDTENAVLETLRGELATYREKFNEARGVNSTRIASLRDQLAVLGPAPTGEDSTPEAAELAAKRKELESQLATLTAPVQVADSAYARADGLVGEIDTIMRNRQAEQLLVMTETPLNPVHWPVAYEALRTAISKLWNPLSPQEIERRDELLISNLPKILFATIAGLVLIFRGRRWSKMIVAKLSVVGGSGIGVWRFVISLLRIVFPLIGLALLAYAARTTGYLGSRGDELVVLIPVLGGFMLGFRWVAEQVFAREDDAALIALSAPDRAEMRFLVSGITLLIIANTLLMQIVTLDGASSLVKTVVSFPFTVLISYGVYRIGRLLRHFGGEVVEQEDEEVTRASTLGRLVRSLGTFAIVVAFAAPALQAVGLFNAAEFILHPTVLTLVILGLVLALQRFGADVYGLITGQGTASREALLPIFFGLILLLLALPVLALAWGVRVSDLTEVWAAFRRGFAIGDSRISPTDFLTFALIFTFGYLATRLAQGALKNNVLPKTKIDKGGQNAIVSGLGYVGIFLAALAAITGAGIDLSSLAIVAGALSVGIGFGLQNIVSNFVSGIILLIERPISEGDWIEVSGGQMGYVRDISVRSTRIETFDRTDVIVPNADLVSGTVTNYTRGNTLGRVIIPVGVAYGTDTRRVETILREIAEVQPMALANPAPNVLFIGFGASSMDFEIRMFLRDVNWMMAVKSDVNHAIAQRFAEEGIEIPFAQQDIWLRNPEALQRATLDKEPRPKAKAAKPAPMGDASKGEGDR